MPMAETVWMRRSRWNHRAFFILPLTLFAIFHCCSQWGFKTPAILFYILQKKEEDEGRGISWLVNSNLRVFSSMVIAFHIIFLLVIMFTNAFEWRSGWRHCWQALGPGFDSQVPHIILSIFSQSVHMQCSFKGPSCTLTPKPAKWP